MNDLELTETNWVNHEQISYKNSTTKLSSEMTLTLRWNTKTISIFLSSTLVTSNENQCINLQDNK